MEDVEILDKHRNIQTIATAQFWTGFVSEKSK